MSAAQRPYGDWDNFEVSRLLEIFSFPRQIGEQLHEKLKHLHAHINVTVNYFQELNAKLYQNDSLIYISR